MTGFGSSGSLAFTGNDLVAVFVLVSEMRAIVGDGNVPDELVTETLGSFKGTHDYIIISDGETAHLAYHTDNPAGQMMVYQNYTSGAGWSPIQEIGLSEWLDIDQMQVNIFGEVTRWPTWMHNDRDRAARESPYGGTIIHGFFLVSLITYFVRAAGIDPVDGKHSLNYGMNKVRILKPTVIGGGIRVRDRIGLMAVEEKIQRNLNLRNLRNLTPPPRKHN